MRYILNPYIALRSWMLVPYAYYIKGERNAKGLTAEEFAFLTECDGRSELPDEAESPLARKFLADGFIRKAENGDVLSDWSRPRLCPNRYFPAMNWMITGKCNYNCIHCFNAADNAPLMSEWSMDEADRLLDQARDCGINAFTITGGEPMLHKSFFEILEGIYARGMYVEELNTNGYFIDRQALDRMKDIGCVPLMKISFDGLGYHDWMRAHQGAEETALRAIRLCVENDFPVKVQTNMNRRNRDSMLKTAERLDAMGVAEMRIIRTTEAPRWVQNAGDACLTFEEYYDEALLLWQKYAQGEHTMDLTIWQFGTLYPRSGFYTLTAVNSCAGEYRSSAPVCKGNRGMVAVAANGNVFPCHQMSGYYEQHGDILGNAKREPLSQLLSGGPYLDEVCTTLGTLREKNTKCAGCAYFELCNGGCRAVALALTGDKLGVDPSKCLFWEQGYHKKIEALLPQYHTVYTGSNRISAAVCCLLSSERFNMRLFPLSRCCGGDTRSLASSFVTSRQSGSGRKEKVKSKAATRMTRTPLRSVCSRSTVRPAAVGLMG